MWQPDDAGYDSSNLFRNSLAVYFLPSADEWYKAAYYDPGSGVYYDYPTGSDLVPDGIDYAGDPNFDAVFDEGFENPDPNDIADVGALSPYGTGGQGGNVFEWEETELDLVNDSVSPFSSKRGVVSGEWRWGAGMLLASDRLWGFPVDEFNGLGFRVASIAIPEPAAILLALAGLAAVLATRCRR